MTNSRIELTEIQRQELLVVLGRRFQKIADTALLELERLTRHPAELTGFQATMSDSIDPQKQVYDVDHDASKDVIEATYSQSLNRREFLTYSLSGLFGLVSMGTGYGWLKSDETVEKLSDKMSGISMDVGNLAATITELRKDTAAYGAMIAEYQKLYQQASYSIAQFKENLHRSQTLYNQIDETGISYAEILEFIINIIKQFPNIGKYTAPIEAILDVLDLTPETITMAEQTLTDLSLWFSEQGQGINERLLSPVQAVFRTIDNDLEPRLQAMQDRLTNS